MRGADGSAPRPALAGGAPDGIAQHGAVPDRAVSDGAVPDRAVLDGDPLMLPGRRLDPSPDRDRPWRLAITLLGGGVVLLVALALAASSLSTWLAGRDFDEVPAVAALGSPSALTLTSSRGAVRVLPSPDVDELTLALVAPGATALPEQGARAKARITRGGTPGGATLEVHQPERSLSPARSPRIRDVLLLVPTALALDLTVHAGAGDVVAEGHFAALEVRSDVGDARLGPLTAPGGLEVTTAVGAVDVELGSPAPASVAITTVLGDVDLLLPADEGARVRVATELGDVAVAAPGTARWQVDASSEIGDVHVDPGLADGAGTAVGTLAVTSDLGDIDLTR